MGKAGLDGDADATMAPQVCLNCKIRKRKCSKELPACALCSRLLLKCDYDYTLPLPSADLQQPVKSSVLPSSPAYLGGVTGLSSAAALFAAVSSTHIKPQHPSRPTASIPREVLDILISSGESVPSVTASYFRTVDTWMPLLWQEEFTRRVERIVMDDDVGLACLLLAMYLIVRPGSSFGSEDEEAYFKTKALVSALSASGKRNIEIAQASLLIVLFEVGHGMTEQARVSMAACVGMTRLLLGNPRKLSTGEPGDTGVGRLWWGIVLLDGYMNIGVPSDQIYVAAGVPDYEPIFVNLPLGNGGGMAAPRPWNGEQHISSQLPYFCRAARSGHLLSKTLDLVMRSVYDGVEQGEVDAMDRTLHETALVLLRQTVSSWEECCPAVRLCLSFSFSALLSLHTRVFEWSNGVVGQEHRTQAAELGIRSTTRMVIDISYRFNVDLGFIDIPALPLVSMGCIYQAAIAHVKFADETFLGVDWCRDLESLKATLEHFSKRWSVGRLYLDRIQKAISAEVGLRAQINHDGFQTNYGV